MPISSSFASVEMERIMLSRLAFVLMSAPAYFESRFIMK